jgi:hypothetical protein
MARKMAIMLESEVPSEIEISPKLSALLGKRNHISEKASNSLEDLIKRVMVNLELPIVQQQKRAR